MTNRDDAPNEKFDDKQRDELFTQIYNPELAANQVLNLLRQNRNKIINEYRMLLGEAVHFLDDKETVEIRRNSNGRIFTRRFGSEDEDSGLVQTDNDALQLGSLISAISGLEFTRNVPSLEFILPFHGARFTIMASPVQSAPMWSIRKRIGRAITIDEYRHSGALSKQHFDQITDYIKDGRPIMIVAPQGVGKTTLAQAILTYVAQLFPSTFFGIIEDTPEINLPVTNKFEWLTCDRIGFTFGYLIPKTLRYGAQSVSIGEIRAFPDAVIEAWTTGYARTGTATIHGSDAVDGVYRIEQLHHKESKVVDRRFFKNALGGFVVMAKAGPNAPPYIKTVTHIESISASNEYRFYKAG